MIKSRILLLLLGLFVSSPLSAQETQIKFSGIWLTAKASEAESLFPVGRKFAAQFGGDDTASLSRKLLSQLREKAKPDGKRLVDLLAPDDYTPSAASGKALVMACALTYEHVDSVLIGGIRKVMAEVGFDLVICDFSDRSVVVSLPGRVLRTDVSERPVTEAKRNELLAYVYSNELPKHFCKLAQARGPEIMGIKSIAVTKLTFLEEARKVFPPWLNSRAEEYYASFAGSNFYEGAGLPMLPFSRGNEVVYCAMRENLADASRLVENGIKEAGKDGTVFVLKKPDYEIELVIPGFQTTTAESGPAGKLVLNCAYSRITIKNGEKVIYSEKHDANVKNLIPGGSSTATPWLAYMDATSNMFFEGSKTILKKKTPAIKQMFTECAPWSLLSKQN